jgi:hypothetical protein
MEELIGLAKVAHHGRHWEEKICPPQLPELRRSGRFLITSFSIRQV